MNDNDPKNLIDSEWRKLAEAYKHALDLSQLALLQITRKAATQEVNASIAYQTATVAIFITLILKPDSRQDQLITNLLNTSPPGVHHLLSTLMTAWLEGPK